MDAVMLAIAIAGAAVPADPVVRWQPYIAEASARCGVPAAWIARVMRAESGGRTTYAGRPIRSAKGAIGLMQLMPATWRLMRDRLGLGGDPDAPRDNILAGACYLRMMHERFGYPGLFAAYNAGPGRYAAYLAGRARLPGETIAYLGTVAGPRSTPPVAPGVPPPQPLFALHFDRVEPASAAQQGPAGHGLFAIRKGVP